MNIFGRMRRDRGGGVPAESEQIIHVELFGGRKTLEVVGESFYQDNLWRVVGMSPPARVDAPVIAVLKAEMDNVYDSRAISVWVSGLLVGHLPRDLAATYRAGLIALEQRVGKPIALNARVVGGGVREDGPGMLGIFPEHDPSDFGVAQYVVYPGQVYEGESEAISDNRLRWLATLPVDPVAAMKKLRQLMTTTTDAMERHYLFLELEQRIYRIGLQIPGALAEFDEVCAAHDAEMEQVLPELAAEFNLIPHLRTYHQMCIRQSKAHNWEEVCRWARRGLELYGVQAGSADWPADLLKRLAAAQRKMSAGG